MKPSLTTAKVYLDALDLSYITRKMCSSTYPLPRWPDALAKTCENLYKRFLWLMVKYHDEGLVPTRDIDEFWHNHILYTQEYTKDCHALLGRYIHHKPAEPTDSATIALLANAFLKTQALYLEEFNEVLQVLQRTGE